jgi:serine/threonine protein phosphatase PrpC
VDKFEVDFVNAPMTAIPSTKTVALVPLVPLVPVAMDWQYRLLIASDGLWNSESTDWKKHLSASKLKSVAKDLTTIAAADINVQDNVSIQFIHLDLLINK